MKPLILFLLLALMPFSSSGQLSALDKACADAYCWHATAPWSCVDPANPTMGSTTWCIVLDASFTPECTESQELFVQMKCPTGHTSSFGFANDKSARRRMEDPELRKVMDEVVSIYKSDLPEEEKMKKIKSKFHQHMDSNPETAELLRSEMRIFHRSPSNYPDPTPITEDQVIKFMELQREAYSILFPAYQKAPAVIKQKNR